jgi:hypothetical protein
MSGKSALPEKNWTFFMFGFFRSGTEILPECYDKINNIPLALP